MSDFWANVAPQLAEEVGARSLALYRWRDSYRQLADRYQVNDAAVLYERVLSGEVSEHPAYEDYLAMRVLQQGMNLLRQEMSALLARGG